MAQQRRSSRGASRQNTGTEAGGALRWYGAGLLSGLFLAFLLYAITLAPEEGEPQAQEPIVAAAGTSPRLQYEFYDVLPNQEITVEVDPAEIPAPRNSGSTSKQFLLQAGSFRDKSDADDHRAKLLLLGLDPRVEETRGDTGRWFRVILGPFPDRSSIARAQSITAQQDIDTLLVERKIN